VLVIGDSPAEERFGGLTLRYLPYLSDQAALARYYQAADLLLSASIAEVWGLAITEAMACGLPVVATAVGGVPEQVISWPESGLEGATGMLVRPGDPAAMAGATARMLDDDNLRQSLGQNAARRAREEFDFNVQVDRYLAYYREIIAARAPGAPPSRRP
jgi:glycosyltransferase involved in cell wall biosynthesis